MSLYRDGNDYLRYYTYFRGAYYNSYKNGDRGKITHTIQQTCPTAIKKHCRNYGLQVQTGFLSLCPKICPKREARTKYVQSRGSVSARLPGGAFRTRLGLFTFRACQEGMSTAPDEAVLIRVREDQTTPRDRNPGIKMR